MWMPWCINNTWCHIGVVDIRLRHDVPCTVHGRCSCISCIYMQLPAAWINCMRGRWWCHTVVEAHPGRLMLLLVLCFPPCLPSSPLPSSGPLGEPTEEAQHKQQNIACLQHVPPGVVLPSLSAGVICCSRCPVFAVMTNALWLAPG